MPFQLSERIIADRKRSESRFRAFLFARPFTVRQTAPASKNYRIQWERDAVIAYLRETETVSLGVDHVFLRGVFRIKIKKHLTTPGLVYII